jgi:hypothetical protein
MTRFWVCLAACLIFPVLLSAGSFTNGGFETGDFTGWTQGGGYWSSPFAAPTPTDYLPGGSHYDMTGNRSAIVGAGTDPISGLPMVYNGNYAARINDSTPNYHVSVASQTVTNYSDPHIYFAWAAVLQASHGIGDSDYFALQLTDDTKFDTLYNVSYDSASTPAYFTDNGNNWFYSAWQIEDLDVSARQGDTFTLTVLGSDCPYGGHGGYVYVDGFSSIIVPPGSGVPEPATMTLMGVGSLILALGLRRRSGRK